MINLSDFHNPGRRLLIAFLWALLILFRASVLTAQEQKIADPLPSWNEGAAKSRITDFVRKVTDSPSPFFVPPEKRIATFDLDGTLIPEKPTYIQVAFMCESIRELAKDHPEWRSEQPFKAVLENDLEYLGHIKTPEVAELLEVSYPGLSIEEYGEKARAWASSAAHPHFGHTYAMLVYRPMVELIAYLQNSGFRVYLCSGSTTEFICALSAEMLGIRPEQIIGSRMGFECIESPEGIKVVKKPQVLIFNDRGEKVVNLDLRIGMRPIIAVGNSNGDIEMFQSVESGDRPSLVLILQHDDRDREFSYDHNAQKALQLAKDKKWMIVSVKKDFRILFLPERLDEN